MRAKKLAWQGRPAAMGNQAQKLSRGLLAASDLMTKPKVAFFTVRPLCWPSSRRFDILSRGNMEGSALKNHLEFSESYLAGQCFRQNFGERRCQDLDGSNRQSRQEDGPRWQNQSGQKSKSHLPKIDQLVKTVKTGGLF